MGIQMGMACEFCFLFLLEYVEDNQVPTVTTPKKKEKVCTIRFFSTLGPQGLTVAVIGPL